MPQIKQGTGASKLSWWKTACAVCVLCAAAAIASPAQTFTTLHTFDNTDGAHPFGRLVQATNGYLYGTTYYGGANDACTDGCGTVFRITPGGTLTTIYSFCSQSGCVDGDYPVAGLVQGTDGELYGTTGAGGTNGYGTVFKVTPSGTLTTLYSFCSQSSCTDGSGPSAGLIQGTDGSFYGTTELGGTKGYGTVFKITPGGMLTTLYSFCSQSNCADGSEPLAGLVQATNGNFYGTTYLSGANQNGTVFRITPSGTLTTLHSFDGTDGSAPSAGLIQGTDGSFYGTTRNGGGANGDGTAFKITPGGTLTTLYSFCSQSSCTDGEYPYAGLVQATNGSLYGTTLLGGANGDGTVFEITRSGTLTTLHNFDSTDETYPYAGLAQDTNGNFYGTTWGGGANDNCVPFNGCGTVFSLSVGLGPFVETQPSSGKVGAAVKILGTNLTGAISVSFNGTAATVTVVSPSLITTTVPSGATTGTVQVVTPGGTLASNVPFRVTP